MRLIELVDWVRVVANRHKEVRGFYTRMPYENNESLTQYPCVVVDMPASSTVYSREDFVSQELEFTFQVLCNTYIHEDHDNPYLTNTEINTNYLIEENIHNEIMSHNFPSGEMEMRERAFGICNHILYGIEYLSPLPTIQILSAKIQGIDRVYNDIVTGAKCTIKLKVSNTYKCEVDNNLIFEDEEYKFNNKDSKE